MKNFIKEYVNENEERFNLPLINREYDDDLVNYIVDCCKSLEVLEYIKFVGYKHITDESKINTNDYINAKSRTKLKKNDPTKYMYIRDSRYTELQLTFELTCGGESKTITKKLLIPVHDDNMFYTIKGNKYFLLYQVVDSSTYKTKSTTVLKSMIPVCIRVKQYSYKSTNNDIITAPIYTIDIFRKDMNIMLFYLAKFGLSKTLKYFSVDKLLFFTNINDNDDNFIYFSINTRLYIKVNKYFFNKYVYVKSITFMFLTLMTNRISIENIIDKDFWINEIGSYGTDNKNIKYEKGKTTMVFFDRIIDSTTRKILKLHKINKSDTYSIVRWMVQNFTEIRKKDNMDLGNKRLRCNETIASFLTKIFSDRVNRVISMGSKATLKNVEEIFKFQGDLILTQMHNSNLLRYDDSINDLDVFGKLKITFKGPNSLGNNNDKNISIKYRGLDPSYLGRLDINVCGTSDPGTSAILTPFCKTHGLYFSSENEPEEFKYKFDKEIYDYIDKESDSYKINCPTGSIQEYYDYYLNLENNMDNMKVEKKRKKKKLYKIDINI